MPPSSSQQQKRWNEKKPGKSRFGHKKAAWAARCSWRWIGQETVCKPCNQIVLYRQLDRHNRSAEHQRNVIGGYQPPVNQHRGNGRQGTGNRGGNGNGSPNQRNPDPNKHGGGNGNGNQQGSNGGGNGMPNGNGQGGGGQKGGGHGGHAIVQGFQSWAQQQPNTVVELRDQLLGADMAMGQSGDIVAQYAASLVQRKIHPAVAAPLNAAANEIAALRHHFSQAYYRFEQVYADRLSYERNQTHKPGDPNFFSNVG